MAEEKTSPSLSQLKIDRSAAIPARLRRKRWITWGIVALVLAAGAFAALGPRKHDVQVTSVLSSTPSAQYAQLTASGYVVAQRRAAVASKGTGRLLELNVREGSVVKKGDVIARLDASDVNASVNATLAGVRQAEAGVRQAESALVQARLEASNAEAELKRSQGLMAQNFVSAQAVDAAATRASVTRAAAQAAQAGVAQAQASLGQAQAQVKVQQVNQDSTVIRAPFDGVVLVKNANVGDMITPFSSASGSQGAVVTMADLTTLEVEADVSESNVAKVKAEQPVEIVLDAIGEQRFRGSVARIVPTVDRAKATVMTKIRFEALDTRVLPEMSAKVTFLSQRPNDAEQKSVLAVNPKAVAEREGKKLVFRIAGDAVEAVPVTPGRTLGDLLEVSGAIKSGERLVLAPAAKLKGGDKVNVAASK